MDEFTCYGCMRNYISNIIFKCTCGNTYCSTCVHQTTAFIDKLYCQQCIFNILNPIMKFLIKTKNLNFDSNISIKKLKSNYN